MCPIGIPYADVQSLSVTIARQKILSEISFSVYSNEIVTLIGPNGAGKSTLIRCLLGFITPNEGQIRLKPGLRLGYMPQKLSIPYALPMSVVYFLKTVPKVQQSQFDKLINLFKIEHLLSRPLQHISGGELQRILMVRSLLHKPNFLILDEPMQGLDIQAQEELYELMHHLRLNEQISILMVSHDLHVVMAKTDRVICLNKHICCQGDPKVVSQNKVFMQLFGLNQHHHLGLYAHQHDHKHDSSGKPC